MTGTTCTGASFILNKRETAEVNIGRLVVSFRLDTPGVNAEFVVDKAALGQLLFEF
jgi:hypothetical protein